MWSIPCEILKAPEPGLGKEWASHPRQKERGTSHLTSTRWEYENVKSKGLLGVAKTVWIVSEWSALSSLQF